LWESRREEMSSTGTGTDISSNPPLISECYTKMILFPSHNLPIQSEGKVRFEYEVMADEAREVRDN